MGWFTKKSPSEEASSSGSSASGLRHSIQRMDIGGVKSSLAAGASAQGSQDDPKSPLVLAMANFAGSLPMHWRAQKTIVSLLLEAGADPKWGGTDGQSPFELAIRKGWTDIVSAMVSKGHSIEVVEGSSYTPLHIALSPVDFKGGDLLPMVSTLLDLGADPNGLGRFGKPPLFVALFNRPNLQSASDYQDVLRLLVDSGASVDYATPNGERLEALLEEALGSS